MTKFTTLLLLGFFAMLPGCVTDTQILSFDDQRLAALSVVDFFGIYHMAQRHQRMNSERSGFSRQMDGVSLMFLSDESWQQLLDEINRRTELTEQEREAALKREIFIGITETALFASWGTPRRSNRTVTANVVSIQHVYGQFGPYVYVRNGKVTSWQD